MLRNFGVNPEYVPRLKSHTLQVRGSDSEGKVRVIELPKHPFFIGTLFFPKPVQPLKLYIRSSQLS